MGMPIEFCRNSNGIYCYFNIKKKRRLLDQHVENTSLSLCGSGGWLESNSYNQNATIIAMQTQ